MDFQFILMVAVFAIALFYVGRKLYRAVFAKDKGCASGCGKCGVDFSTIENPKKNG